MTTHVSVAMKIIFIKYFTSLCNNAVLNLYITATMLKQRFYNDVYKFLFKKNKIKIKQNTITFICLI